MDLGTIVDTNIAVDIWQFTWDTCGVVGVDNSRNVHILICGRHIIIECQRQIIVHSRNWWYY